MPLDISLGALPYEVGVLDRATPFVVAPGVALRTCSAEDLVVLKAVAGRVQDWNGGMDARNGGGSSFRMAPIRTTGIPDDRWALGVVIWDLFVPSRRPSR